MAKIHFVLQGKGGVGKSYVASLLAQHYLDNDIKPQCFDTDPVNRTFASYKAFNAQTLDLLNEGNIDPRQFDGFVDALISAPDDAVVVIDNGASTFIPLCAYLEENDVIGYLVNRGHSVMFHSIVTGGQALIDTMNGLEALLVNFPNIPVTVWLNEYFGKVAMNGTHFEQTRLFNNPKYNIHGMITISERRKETFGYDLEQMLKHRMTFKEAISSDSGTIMSRQRLGMVRKDMNEQITQANL